MCVLGVEGSEKKNVAHPPPRIISGTALNVVHSHSRGFLASCRFASAITSVTAAAISRS